MGVQEATVRQYVTRFRKWIATERETRNLGAVHDHAKGRSKVVGDPGDQVATR